MKTPKYPAILLYSVLVMFVHAADAPRSVPTVAVYDFTHEGGAAGDACKVTTLVTADLTTETNLVLVERAELTKALSEQAFGISGMVSSEAAAKIGKITGAKVLVAGQVMRIGGDHLVIVADIIGTETGRLFAAKVEGAAEHLMELSSQLSREIAQTISDQATNLIGAAQESREARLARIVRSVTGTNRPSVAINMHWWAGGKAHENSIQEAELGTILLQAGFSVVDDKSDQKPDIQITGTETSSEGPQQKELFSFSDSIDLKVQERRTGNIIAVEHQAASASAGARMAALVTANRDAVDALAEKVLPLLAK